MDWEKLGFPKPDHEWSFEETSGETMAKPITETVTVTREVSSTFQDMIGFARSVSNADQGQLEDDAWMVERAREYWDAQHGE